MPSVRDQKTERLNYLRKSSWSLTADHISHHFDTQVLDSRRFLDALVTFHGEEPDFNRALNYIQGAQQDRRSGLNKRSGISSVPIWLATDVTDAIASQAADQASRSMSRPTTRTASSRTASGSQALANLDPNSLISNRRGPSKRKHMEVYRDPVEDEIPSHQRRKTPQLEDYHHAATPYPEDFPPPQIPQHSTLSPPTTPPSPSNKGANTDLSQDDEDENERTNDDDGMTFGHDNGNIGSNVMNESDAAEPDTNDGTGAQKHPPKATCPALQVWIEAKRRELSTVVHDYTTKSTTNSSRLSTVRSEIAAQEKDLEKYCKEHWIAEQSVLIAQPALQIPQSLRNLNTTADHGIDLDNVEGFNEMVLATAKFFDALQAKACALKDGATQAECKIMASKKQVTTLQREQTEILTGLEAFRDFELQFVEIGQG